MSRCPHHGLALWTPASESRLLITTAKSHHWAIPPCFFVLCRIVRDFHRHPWKELDRWSFLFLFSRRPAEVVEGWQTKSELGAGPWGPAFGWGRVETCRDFPEQCRWFEVWTQATGTVKKSEVHSTQHGATRQADRQTGRQTGSAKLSIMSG